MNLSDGETCLSFLIFRMLLGKVVNTICKMQYCLQRQDRRQLIGAGNVQSDTLYLMDLEIEPEISSYFKKRTMSVSLINVFIGSSY